MRAWPSLVTLLVLTVAPASAQDASLTSSAQGFTFGDPSGVGLRSYSMVSSRLSITQHFQPWLSAGTAAEVGRASLSSRGTSSVDVGGLASVEAFGVVRMGALEVSAAFAPNLGRTELSSDQLVVTSLAAAEILPFPIRGWGSGSRYWVDATLRLESAGYEVEFFGSLRRSGWFSPFDSDAMQYRLGGQIRAGLHVGRRLSAFSWASVEADFSTNAADQTDEQEVYEPGSRARFLGTVVFPVANTSLRLQGELYFRDKGSVVAPVSTLQNVPLAVLGGGVDTRARSVAAVRFESRATIGVWPLIVTGGARYGRGTGEIALGWGGVATELEVRPPLPGLWYVVPSGRIYRGSIELGEEYGSSVVAWELGAQLRWTGQ